MTSDVLSTADPSARSKSAHVKGVFENSKRYLAQRSVDILFRRETVKSFAGEVRWGTMLDIGCGDGTISLQLLAPDKELTLLDLSASMTELVRQNLPDEAMADQVTIRNENFVTAAFPNAPFDLIVTVGVLAHVDSLDTFLAKVRNTLGPGGHLIIEFTDCYHPVGQIGRFFDRLKETVAPAKYSTNKLSRDHVFAAFVRHHLRLRSAFRYSRIPLPLFSRLVPARLQHGIARTLFGNAQRNTLASLGNEYICLLEAER